MKADKYLFDGEKKCRIDELPTGADRDDVDKEEIVEKFEKNLTKMAELQNVFYADRKEGLIVVLQALDAAGKDSLIRHVCSGMNPQGVSVTCLKRPSEEELAHDYLWRVNRVLPKRGEILILNRSYYEDIITAKALHLKDGYHMAKRVIGESEDDFIGNRIRQVKDYERYLYENSYRVVKVLLNVSKDTQRQRFLERIDKKEKNWKFEAGDLETREQFDEYLHLFDKVISKTATKESPWYVIPADQKWYTRFLLSEILIDVLEDTKPEYPELPKEEQEQLAACKARLLAEKGTPDELIEREKATKISGDGAPDGDNAKTDETKTDKTKKQKKEHKKEKKQKKDKEHKKDKKSVDPIYEKIED
jgi:PPK2 family polyphosphate:nucleotide phosphotransferase